MPDERMEIIQGTLEMLILKSLVWGPRHGWDVLCWLRDLAGTDLSLEEGAIYPALHRLQDKELVSSEWGLSDNNRRARYYRLTERGREELANQTRTWGRYIRVVDRILSEAGA